jgi:hypothetical protein
MIRIRKGQSPAPVERAEFGARFRASFHDPAFRAEDPSIARLEEIAWQAFAEGRKAPFTQKAGPGYADPDYDLSTEWIATKQRIAEAQRRWAEPTSPSRVLLICGSARNDGTCPGEMSKTFRLLELCREELERAGIESSRCALSDWLDWMGFIDAGVQARLDRYIGYFEPYATSHDALDRDAAMQEEARNVARAVAKAVVELRSGRLQAAQPHLSRPRPK